MHDKFKKSGIEDLHPHLIIRDYWDRLPNLDDLPRDHCHVIRMKEQTMLLDFLVRRREGAILVSGIRGVGKTRIIFYAINEAINSPEIRKFIPVLVNAPSLEINKKNSTDKGIEIIDFKKVILQNIVRWLYETSLKYDLILDPANNKIAFTENVKKISSMNDLGSSQSSDPLDDKNRKEISSKITDLHRRADSTIYVYY